MDGITRNPEPLTFSEKLRRIPTRETIQDSISFLRGPYFFTGCALGGAAVALSMYQISYIAPDIYEGYMEEYSTATSLLVNGQIKDYFAYALSGGSIHLTDRLFMLSLDIANTAFVIPTAIAIRNLFFR